MKSHVPTETNADIVLVTLNARYIHASLGLRYLRANLGPWRDKSVLLERLATDAPSDIAEAILAFKPRLVGFGVYIWNVETTLAVIKILRAVAPDVTLVLGGPEVSYESDSQDIVALADVTVTGEGETVFRQIVEQYLGTAQTSLTGVVSGGLPDLSTLALPYDELTDEDLAHRYVYVEASRGCPFRCEFCLSSLDQRVRPFPLDNVMAALDSLMARGASHFRFVDRTFNLDVKTGRALLSFFRERQSENDLFLHFEMVPDRFPEGLRDAIQWFPAGVIQFEVGIQTFDAGTSRRISRPLKVHKVEENLRWLREETEVHLHTDLIVGLPGEDLESFGRGFDQLIALRPHEIQVGILKRLRGTPVVRHTDDYGLVFSSSPPYEVLQTRDITFSEMQRLKRFARAWDLVSNRGQFPTSRDLVLGDAPFTRFLTFSDWLGEQVGAIYKVALPRLAELIMRWLVLTGTPEALAREHIITDYSRGGTRRVPGSLSGISPAKRRRHKALNARQRRHQGV